MGGEGDIRVTKVSTEAETAAFLRLPWAIYQDDPYWVPPLLPLQRRFLDRRYGHFFQVGEAQYFLAYRGGVPAGRISAHISHRYEQYQDKDTGFFGFFECLPDAGVAAALLAAAAAWLGQRGKNRLQGPMNFTVYDEMGLLVQGFDSLPAIFQTHNPPYYEELLTASGFYKAFDWHALRLTNRHFDQAAMEKRLENILARQSLRITSYRAGEVARRAEEAYEMFNEAWAPNWGHVPASREQFEAFLKDIRPLLRPGLVNLILDGDRLAGFGIVIPDLNPLVQKFNGRLSPWGRLRLYYAARFAPVCKVRALIVGVRQPYQRRFLHHAMVMRTYLHLVRHTPCDFCDFSLIPENLTHWLKTLESFGAEKYKTFRVLEKAI